MVKVIKEVEVETKTPLEIEEMYANLTRLKKINVLWEALDFMQQYNERTRFDCVAMAMGYQDIEGLGKEYVKMGD